MNKNLPRFSNGDDLRESLSLLKVGSYLYYHDILHRVIDAKIEQGHRIAAVKNMESLSARCDLMRQILVMVFMIVPFMDYKIPLMA